MTHWTIDDGTPEGKTVEIVDFVDDYSRMTVAALTVVVVPVATAADVVFTAQFRGGRCGFPTEYLLGSLELRQLTGVTP